MRKRNRNSKILLYLVLTVIGVICIFPYAWLLSASFKPESQIFKVPPELIPSSVTFENYIGMFTSSPALTWLWNSFYITVVVVVMGSLVASMAGFAYAKLRFRGSSLLFLLPLCAMMVPNEIIIIPLFQVWGKLGFINTHLPLIMPNIIGVGGMFGVFLFRQFYLSVPTELCDAAKVDGCTPFGIYLRIMLPMSQSTLATLAVFNFMNAWNDFLDPLIYLNSTDKYTISLGLGLFTDMTGTMWGQLMAACVISTLPLIIAFFIAQNKFIESVALSGVKG